MTLVTGASVTLGNLRYAEQVAAVSAELALLPSVSTAVATFPAAVEVSAAPGDEGSVALHGGEGEATVLTGRVTGICRSHSGTEVVLADAGARLGAARPVTTFDTPIVADAIRSMASDAGVASGLVLTTMALATYAAHQQRTAAEHIAHLARLGGTVAWVDGDGRLTVAPWPTGPAMTALRYDREFVHYRTEQDLPPVAAVTVGGGPAGAVAAPDALAHSVDALTGGEADPAPDRRWAPHAVLRTPAAVDTATRAANTTAAASAWRLTARCWLQPALRPGAVLEVQEVPASVSGGPWLVTAVHHRASPSGGFTDVAGVSAGAGAGGLLAQAAGALGGVL